MTALSTPVFAMFGNWRANLVAKHLPMSRPTPSSSGAGKRPGVPRHGTRTTRVSACSSHTSLARATTPRTPRPLSRACDARRRCRDPRPIPSSTLRWWKQLRARLSSLPWLRNSACARTKLPRFTRTTFITICSDLLSLCVARAAKIVPFHSQRDSGPAFSPRAAPPHRGLPFPDRLTDTYPPGGSRNTRRLRDREQRADHGPGLIRNLSTRHPSIIARAPPNTL